MPRIYRNPVLNSTLSAFRPVQKRGDSGLFPLQTARPQARMPRVKPEGRQAAPLRRALISAAGAFRRARQK